MDNLGVLKPQFFDYWLSKMDNLGVLEFDKIKCSQIKTFKFDKN